MRIHLSISMAATLLAVGCSDNSQPLSVMTPARQAELQAEIEAAQAEQALADQLYQERGGRFGEPTFRITNANLTEEIQEKLRVLLPDRAVTNAQFVEAIESLREQDPWLDAAVDDPWRTSMVRPDQTPPGPPLIEFAKLSKRMADTIRDEYLAGSNDSKESKDELIELYEANMLRLCADRSIDDEIQGRIFQRYKDGGIEPLLLLLNLTYELTTYNRYHVSTKVLAGLQSRTFGPWTKIALISECKMSFTDFPIDQRRQLTLIFFDAVVEMLHEISKLDDWSDEQLVLTYTLRPAFYHLNSFARVELVDRIIDLYQSDECPPACDEYFVQSMIAELHHHIVRYARGGDFIYKLTEKQYREFSSHSELNTYHLMRSFVLRPDDVFCLRRIMEAELVSSDSPYRVSQLGRVAQTMAYDYQAVAAAFKNRSLPRWGGSRQKQRQLLEHTVELALIPQAGEAIYDKPLDAFLYEVGNYGNLSKRLQFPKALDEMQQRFLDLPDALDDDRFSIQMLIVLLRLAWDRSDLETVTALIEVHGSYMSEGWLHSARIPVDWLNAFNTAFLDVDSDKQALLTLQRELIVGDEHFDDARLTRIKEAIETIQPIADEKIKKLTKVLDAGRESKDKSTPTSEDAESDPPTRSVKASICSFHWQDLEDDPELCDHHFELRSWTLIRDGLARLYETARQYHAGEPVEILKGQSIIWSLIGNGAVERNKEDLKVTVHNLDSTLLAEYPVRFRLPFEVEMTVRQGACDADAYGIALFAGPVATSALSAEASGRSLRYSPGYPMVMQDRLPRERLADSFYHEQRIIPVPSRATLRIRMTEDSSRSFLNDQSITVTEYPNRPLGILGFGRKAGDRFTGVPDRSSSYTIESFKVTPL